MMPRPWQISEIESVGVSVVDPDTLMESELVSLSLDEADALSEKLLEAEEVSDID